MEGIIIIIVLFILHWFGDFVLQSRKIAETKSTSIKSLSIHVLLYSCAFTPMALYIGFSMEYIYFISLLFAGHWITDFLTSKATTYFWKNKMVKSFFTMIGFDQLLHAIQLLLLYQFFIV